jgi:cysteine desulfurase/selenocysteine lyase
MSYVQFSNGFRCDLEELASIKGGHALVINASQAAGVFEIDVKRMKIDALCSTGHKWMLSGYGSGFVYISKELQAAARQRTIGWLSVQDPYGTETTRYICGTMCQRGQSSVVRTSPACLRWAHRLS